tara:strand:- start:522 stop:1046 length:525 start_codon:yes stop_codon:yes gene_type:complete
MISSIVAFITREFVLIVLVIPPRGLQSALVAYIHYLSLILCFGALLYERLSLKSKPSKREAISMIFADIIYGLAGIALLISGIFRVIRFGQGADFYTQNPVFWTKIILFGLVGSLSIYPTVTYVLWAIPISKGKLPEVSENLVSRLRTIINIELVGFASIPLIATLMARGVGLT